MPKLTFDESVEMKEPMSSQNNKSNNEKQLHVQTRQKPSAVERFKEISLLQKHYMYLLKTRCEQLDDTKIRKFVDPDKGVLRRTMLCFRQLAQYVPVLM